MLNPVEFIPPGFFLRCRLVDKLKSTTSRWFILLLVMSGVFLSTMDSGMLSVALPTIMRSFGLSLEHSELIITSYLLTITVTLVLWGKLADLYGRVQIYLFGIATFGLGALCCYLSVNFNFLLLSRVLQGLGASMMMSSGPAIIKSVFPSDYLGRSLGLVGIATACGLLTGPFVSGYLLTIFTWKAIFIVTLPVNIVSFLFGIFLFREYLFNGIFQAEPIGFDWMGYLCWSGLVVIWLTVFHRLHELLSFHNSVAIVVFLMLLLLFFRVENRAKNPILPLFLFKERGYWVGVLTAAISFATLFSVLILIPFYLEYIYHLSIEKVGVVMMALPATIIVFSPFSGWLYDKIGARFLTSFGLAVSGAAILSLSWLSLDSSITSIMVRLAIVGAGQSIFLSPNSASVLANVSEKYVGISAGILATARNFGMVTGATLSASLFSHFYWLLSDGRSIAHFVETDVTFFLSAWKYTFSLIASVSFLATFLSFRRH